MYVVCVERKATGTGAEAHVMIPLFFPVAQTWHDSDPIYAVKNPQLNMRSSVLRSSAFELLLINI